MNNKFKKTVAGALAATMMMTTCVPAFAYTPVDKLDMQSQYKQVVNNNTDALVVLNNIEAAVEKEGYTVIEGLEIGKAKFQAIYNQTEDLNEKVKIQEIITGYENMITEYKMFEANRETVNLLGVEHPVLSPAVSAIVSFFSVNNYMLSAELLTHAKENTKESSTYRPTLINHVYQTTEYVRIRNGKDGSSLAAAFEGGSSVAEKDCYYAIHGCRYYKSGNNITIHDVYDFAPGSGDLNYDNLAGTAVNAMFMAQTAGVIVPYNVVISM
ncbi:MAG: hypothetical protein IKU46_10410 [Peptococcaceae bacterium]|nr:hypothetical protein [Peptococcaceae bacterium]